MQSVPFSTIQSHLPNNLPPSPSPYLNPLPSYWTKNYISPHQNSNQFNSFPNAQDEEKGVEIVVIGSGITGVCTAYRIVQGLLARGKDEVGGKKEKVKIIILEAREFCSGATGRNGGHLSPSGPYHFSSISTAHSLSDAIAAVNIEDRATNWILDLCTQENWDKEVALTRNGTLHIFEDEEAENVVRMNLEAARDAGVDVEINFLSSDEVLKGFGAEAHSAILIPGNNLYPLKLISKLYSKALKDIEEGDDAGVALELWTHILVENVTESKSKSKGGNGKRWSIKTSRGSIDSNFVLHSTNAYASYLIPSLSNGPSRIIPTRGQVLSILPSPTSNPKWNTGFSANDGFEYYFQRPQLIGGQIILGGGRSQAPPEFEFGLTNDGEISKDVGMALRGYIVDQFPGLSLDEDDSVKGKEKEGMKVDLEWTGIMGFTESGAPLVGPVFAKGTKLEGQFISAGYTGHGMSRAPACAEAISLMVLAELGGESYTKPVWLPNYYTTESYKTLEKSTNSSKRNEEEVMSCCCVV